MELAFREVSLPRVAPALEPMRPDTPHDPTFELLEQTADMSLAVVKPPSTNDQVDLGDQLRGRQGNIAPGASDDLVLEVTDGLRPREGIEISPACSAADLVATQP